MKANTKKLTFMAMLCAIAYVVTVVGRIHVGEFLSFDLKDVIITIGGFMFGPLAAVAISLVVCTVEMITVSTTGPWGLLMNVLASCSFACTASFIYKKNRSLAGMAVGLISGVACMTGVMLLWNYLITPIYLGYPREAVVEMLVPLLLPFNLVKSSINAAATALVYMPVSLALRSSGLLPALEENPSRKSANVGVVLVSAMVLVTCTMLVLSMNGTL